MVAFSASHVVERGTQTTRTSAQMNDMKTMTFLERICAALEMSPKTLARKADIPYKEIEPLLDARHLIVEIDRDDTWRKIYEYVGRRNAMHMAVLNEMSKALQADRVKRAARIQRYGQREKRPSPRSRE